MPWKLVLTIIYVVSLAVFAGFNLDNKTDLWLVKSFKDVPVFLIAVGGIGIGILISIPHFLFRNNEITEEDVLKFETLRQKKLDKQRKIEEKKIKKEMQFTEKLAKVENKKNRDKEKKNLAIKKQEEKEKLRQAKAEAKISKVESKKKNSEESDKTSQIKSEKDFSKSLSQDDEVSSENILNAI